MKKIILSIAIVIAAFVTPINAVGFNEAAAKDLITSFVTPLTSFLLWAVPVTAAAACLAAYLRWVGKDEDEKEQKPIAKQLKTIIFWAVVVESIRAIFKIFGL